MDSGIGPVISETITSFQWRPSPGQAPRKEPGSGTARRVADPKESDDILQEVDKILLHEADMFPALSTLPDTRHPRDSRSRYIAPALARSTDSFNTAPRFHAKKLRTKFQGECPVLVELPVQDIFLSSSSHSICRGAHDAWQTRSIKPTRGETIISPENLMRILTLGSDFIHYQVPESKSLHEPQVLLILCRLSTRRPFASDDK